MAYAIKPSLPVVARGLKDAAVISETTATGPVASCLLDPNSAAIIGGRKDAYNP
jgi:hypothetical protein